MPLVTKIRTKVRKRIRKRSIKKLENEGYIIQPPSSGCEVEENYRENDAVGARNFQEKLNRVKTGGPFEWPDMVALNKVVASIAKSHKRTVNIGSGTGTFESLFPIKDDTFILASEFDKECVEWCMEHRSNPHIQYSQLDMRDILNKYGKFDLAITIDVIEHVRDYCTFLNEFSKLADTAILTTPNKSRSRANLTANPPLYYQHVREWTAGEFYWVLKCFYNEVELRAMEDPFGDSTIRISLLSTLSPLIAICRLPKA